MASDFSEKNWEFIRFVVKFSTKILKKHEKIKVFGTVEWLIGIAWCPGVASMYYPWPEHVANFGSP